MNSHKSIDSTPSKTGLFAPDSKNKEDYRQILGDLSLTWKEAVLYVYSTLSETDEHFKSFKALVSSTSESEHRFLIWDTTCHIHSEIAKKEKNNLFLMDENILQSLCKLALEKAMHDTEMKANLSEGLDYFLGGVAVWNLLLPKSDGGIFPDEKYQDFLNNIHNALAKFTLPANIGTVEEMRHAFLSFKKYALKFKQIDPELRNELAELLIEKNKPDIT